jgi:hypothetical protein
MKQGSKMMTNDAFETACTKAVARLLLGNRKLKAGIMLTGGGRLDLNIDGCAGSRRSDDRGENRVDWYGSGQAA